MRYLIIYFAFSVSVIAAWYDVWMPASQGLKIQGPSVIVAGEYYIDATGGNNTNNGQTTSTPWQTLIYAQTNALMSDGNTLFLKRGETWNETFTVPTNNLTINAYGAGALPMIDGQATRTKCILNSSYFGLVTKNVRLQNATSAAWEVFVGTNTIQDCYVDGSGVTNPLADCIAVGSDGYAIVSGCTIEGADDDGFTLHTTASGFVYDCVFTNNDNSINNSGTTMELTVSNCTFTGVAVEELNLGTTVSVFKRCWFKGSATNEFKFLTGATGEDTTFEYCIFDGSLGDSVSDATFGINAATVAFKNCTFYGGTNDSGSVSIDGNGLTMTNCLMRGWNRCAFNFSGTWEAVNNNATDFTTYNPDTDTGPVSGDPLLVDPDAGDYEPGVGSPAINAGVTISGLTIDFLGNPLNGATDIGAIEVQ